MSLRDRLEASTELPAETAAAGARDTDEVKRRMHQVLIETLGPRLPLLEGDEAAMRRQIEIRLRELLAEETTPLSTADRQSIVTVGTMSVLSLGLSALPCELGAKVMMPLASGS